MDVTFFAEEEVKRRRIVFQTMLLLTVIISVVLVANYIRIQRYDLVPFVAGPILIPAALSLIALYKWSVDLIAPIFIYYLFTVMVIERLFCSWDYLVDVLYIPSLITISFFTLKEKQRWIASLYLILGLGAASFVVYMWEPFPVLYKNDLVMNSVWISGIFTVLISLLIHGIYSHQLKKYTAKISETTLEQRRLQEQWSMLLSTVIHDFNNSITILQMNIDAQSDKTPNSKYMESASSALTRIQKMISNLKSLRAAFSVSQKIPQEQLDIAEIIKTIPLVFQDQIRRKELKVEINIPDDCNAKVNVNPITLVNHILANIIGNAIKFCPAHGRIIVDLTDAGNQLIIQTINQVVAIDPLQRKIFEQQANGSTYGSSGEQGHGLGLHLIRKFCQQEQFAFQISVEQNKSIDSRQPIVRACLSIPK